MLAEQPTQTITDGIYFFPGYTISLYEKGIIHLRFEKDFHGDANDARSMVEVFRKFKGEQKPGLLVVYTEGNMFSKEAREYVASEEVSGILKADAFVIRSLALRIVGNGYLKINKPNRPTRIFNSEEEALHWLRQIV